MGFAFYDQCHLNMVVLLIIFLESTIIVYPNLLKFHVLTSKIRANMHKEHSGYFDQMIFQYASFNDSRLIIRRGFLERTRPLWSCCFLDVNIAQDQKLEFNNFLVGLDYQNYLIKHCHLCESLCHFGKPNISYLLLFLPGLSISVALQRRQNNHANMKSWLVY